MYADSLLTPLLQQYSEKTGFNLDKFTSYCFGKVEPFPAVVENNVHYPTERLTCVIGSQIGKMNNYQIFITIKNQLFLPILPGIGRIFLFYSENLCNW